MTLRIIDAEDRLCAAIDALEGALDAWAGGRADAWRRDGRGGTLAQGASYARREDVYLWIERRPRELEVGVALSAGDLDLIRIVLPREEPALERKRAAAAVDEAGQAFLLIAAQELARQGVRDVFRRLAGAARVKRAALGERDYVLIGPLNDPGCAEALLSIAALQPRFERHIDRLAALAAGSDEADEGELYRVAPGVRRQHRAHAKASLALFERLSGAGFVLETVEMGPAAADFAMSRGQETLVFEIRVGAELGDLQRGLGQLALVAPRALGLTRILALPAARDGIGEAMDPFLPALEELGVSVVFYDFSDGEAQFFIGHADAAFLEPTRALLV